MGNEIFDTGDTLANAIMASLIYHRKQYAVILSEKLRKREQMRREPMDDEEEMPLSDVEFSTWVSKYFN